MTGMTMKKLASLANVSVATVSKVINGRDEHISEETRQKIRQLVQSSGYRPNAIAKGLKVRQTNTIAFILPDISNPFFPEIARGIEDEASRHGFTVLFCNTDNDVDREKNAIAFLQSKMIDGLIMIQTTRESLFEPALLDHLPVVVVDRGIDTNARNIGKIYVNSQRALFDATARLIGFGCRHIAFISADLGTERDYRYEGYEKAILEHGLQICPDLIFRHDYDEETGAAGVRTILSRIPFDGLVCGNDLIAAGAMQTIHSLGFRIPDDIRVIGFDDINFAKYLSPPLTTMAQPAYAMGEEAARMLIACIERGEALYTKELPYHMTVRESDGSK